MLKLAADAAFAGREKGVVVELGVFRGRSLRFLRGLCPPATEFHALDSFRGLPEAWDREPAGSYTTHGAIPDIQDVAFHVGWFNETLPALVDSFDEENDDVALVHLDCDLYSSTADALSLLGPKLRPGAVLVFDDFLAHPTWQQDQAKAFEEAVHRFRWRFALLAASLPTKQVVVQLL